MPWDAGGVDLSMRFIQKDLEEALGILLILKICPEVVRSGLSRCALAKPDGYTLCTRLYPVLA